VNDHDEAHLYDDVWPVINRLDERPRGRVERSALLSELGISDPLFEGVAVAEVPESPENSEPGPWIIAGFDSPCAFGDMIAEGDTIRADGDGGWEHASCAVDIGNDPPISGMTRRPADYRGWKEGDLW